MASSPITSWQINGETVETVADFILGGSKITADGDCSHEIKRHLFLERAYVPWQHIKEQRYYFANKVPLVKAVVFPVDMYGYEIWTIKKAECWRIAAFKLCCWRRLLRVSLTARRSNQSIIMQVSPEYSEAETPILWPPDGKNWLTRKDPVSGNNQMWEEKGITENEIVGWYHWLDGHEFE